MFGATSEHVRLPPNMFGASSELASVIKFGFNFAFSERRAGKN